MWLLQNQNFGIVTFSRILPIILFFVDHFKVCDTELVTVASRRFDAKLEEDLFDNVVEDDVCICEFLK